MMQGNAYKHILNVLIILQVYKKQLNKLKDEVGMAGSKSTRTRFVGIITSTIHPYTLVYHTPIDVDLFLLSF